jgi:hydroxylamine reductase (hybrid-cluster protein)
MVLSIGFVVLIVSNHHYLITCNDIMQHLADTVYKILNKEVHIIPIPWAMDGAWLNSRAEVFETSALSCGLSLAMSSVNTVASWLAREIET